MRRFDETMSIDTDEELGEMTQGNGPQTHGFADNSDEFENSVAE